jgi:hypothetical protein
MATMETNTTEPDLLGSDVKHAAKATADADLNKEERAAQDAKLRPEREAKFADYLVSILCVGDLCSVDAYHTPARLFICEGVGHPTHGHRRHCLYGIRCYPAPDECDIW